jgi:hypothetical protein
VSCITVKNIPKPDNTPVAQKEWKLVKIQLTAEQKAELKKLGVNTDELKIQTVDISRLANPISN